MVTLIHGNDTASSRKFFISVQQKASNPVLLDGGSFTLSDLSALLQTSGLFSETKYIFIDQPFRKKQKDQIKELISLLVNNSLEHEIYLWENKEVERAIQAVSKEMSIKEFKLPVSLFTFLDSLKPQNTKLVLSLFHASLTTTEVEVIFFMLIRHFRMLLFLASSGEDKIEEIKKLAAWQKTKLENQAKLWGVDMLISKYIQLSSLDQAQKTGNLVMPLTEAIDFFLIEL